MIISANKVVNLFDKKINFGHQMGTEFNVLFDSPTKKALSRAEFERNKLVGPVGFETPTSISTTSSKYAIMLCS